MNTTKNSVMKYSHFTPALTRAVKESGARIHCKVDDGAVYVCTGYFAVKLTGMEYDALIRPVTQRDPGNWVLHENGDTSPDPIDLPKILSDDGKAAAHTVAPAPMFFEAKGTKRKSSAPQLVGYYSKSGDFVAAFNSHYAAIISPTLDRKSAGSTSPMMVYIEGEPVAMILPVRIETDSPMARAVRAWFTENDGDGEQAGPGESVEKLINENGELRRKCEDAKKHEEALLSRIETLQQCYGKAHADFEAQRRQVEELKAALASKNEQIETLTERLNAQPDPQPQEAAADAQPQDKAAALVEKLAALSGVTATVKGAQTAAPVVWLTGDTDAHKDKIEEMGGKWSAWYFKIA